MTPDLPQELMACPFCGTDQPMSGSMKTKGAKGWWIECRDCPALVEEETEAEAIAAWNTRTPAVATDGQGMGLRVVFDGPPGHESGRFVECETADGKSVNAGTWHEREDGHWELRIGIPTQPSSVATDEGVVERLLEKHIQRCRDAVAECLKWSPAQAEWSRARDALLNFRDDLHAAIQGRGWGA